MIAFAVAPECFELGLRARALVLEGLRINAASDVLRADIGKEARRVREQFASLAEIRALPELVEIREIIRAVGVKPKNHPPSTQKLFEFAWKQGTLPAINNLVDAYNLMSLRTRCSLGAHDLALAAAPIVLRLFHGSESFQPLGSRENKQIRAGEFGYVDAQDRVVCRLDSLQADFSKVTTSTTDALLIIESTTAQTSEQLDRVVAEVSAAIEGYCAGMGEVIAVPQQLPTDTPRM